MSRNEKIIIIGGGGHGKVLIDAILLADRYEIAGVIDNDAAKKVVAGVKIIGNDEKLEELYESGCQNAFIGIGSVGDPTLRIKLSRKLKKIGFTLPVVAHPSAVIAKSAHIEEGTYIAAGAVIGPEASIGKHVIINSNASVDHDGKIGDFVHIAPGAILSGGVEVGENSHIGTGAVIIEYKKIGSWTIVGAGSVVVANLPDNCKAYGNPCKVVGDKS